LKETVSSLIEKLRNKPNARQFAALFDDGDDSDYTTSAAAELALCKIIAMETIDPSLIDGVFQESALYRPKTWNRDKYGDNIIQQAIAAVKVSRGIPPFIVQSTRKGKTVDKVSEPLLAEWVRQHVEYRFVKDSGTHNMTAYLYEDGVFMEIDDKTFEGIIKSPVAQYDITLVDMRQVGRVFRDLSTDLQYLPANSMNSNENIINFENGILDLATLELKPHSPEYLSTIQIPCAWVGEPQKTPVFDEYMDTLTRGNQAMQRFLLQFMGACLSNVPGFKLKKMVFLVGPGDTGKSQFKRLIELLLGEKNCCSMGLKQLETEFGPINIRHKRLVGSADMSFASVKEVNMLKMITGGDSFSARQMYQAPTDFVYTGLAMFCTNKLPKFGGDNGPWVYERICVVNCDNIIPKAQQDKHLLDKMFAERDGIVYKAVMAFCDVIANGLRLDEPPEIVTARAAYASTNSIVGNFIQDCMKDSTGIPDSRCSIIKDIFQVFTKWCRINNNGHLLSKRDFMLGLAQYFNKPEDEVTKRVGNGFIIKGYTLSDEADAYR
jgi:P4 family phage/plasmid primase-like protien